MFRRRSFRRRSFRILTLALPIVLLVFSACRSSTELPAATSEPTSTVTSVAASGQNLSNPASFRAALLEALAVRDEGKLQSWMTQPFLSGAWRGQMSDTTPVDALQSLYSDQLDPANHLTAIMDADLRGLMGGRDPLSITGKPAATDAFLVGGWGKDARDEAVLFIARGENDNLKWRGWMQIKGGFSGERLGGAQAYKNDAHGYSVFVPKGFTVSSPSPDYDVIVGAALGAPGLGYIYVEPANGRTSREIADAAVNETKAQMGPEWAVPIPTILDIEGSQAVVVTGFPGQDITRKLFMVHGDTLYRMDFMPDNPRDGDRYLQMEDTYAMVVNTFHFAK